MPLIVQPNRRVGQRLIGLVVGLTAGTLASGALGATASAQLWAPAATALPGGKVLIAVPRYRGDLTVARLRRSGRLDRSFGRDGFASTRVPAGALTSIADIVVRGQGVIDVAVNSASPTHGGLGFQRIVQFDKQGRLDRRFGVGGTAEPLRDHGVDRISAMTVAPDGRLVVGAHAYLGPCTQQSCKEGVLVGKLDDHGDLDPSFGAEGIRTIDVFATSAVPAIDPVGRIVAVASGYGRTWLVRMAANGDPDPSFGGGTGQVEVGLSNYVTSVVFSPDGEIYAGGGSKGTFAAVALHEDGSIDEGFGEGGVFARRLAERQAAGGSILRLGGGDLLLSGPLAPECGPGSPDPGRNCIAAGVLRLNSAGEVATSFGHRGVAQVPIARGHERFLLSVGVQTFRSRDGIRVATPTYPDRPPGTTTLKSAASRPAVVALRADGAIDERYGQRGIARPPNPFP